MSVYYMSCICVKKKKKKKNLPLLDASVKLYSWANPELDQIGKKKVREKSKECHNHKPQLFPDTKRKRKPTNPNR